MVDLNLVLADRSKIIQILSQKNSSLTGKDIDDFIQNVEQQQGLQRQIEDLNRQINENSTEVKEYVTREKSAPPAELVDKGRSLKVLLKPLESKLQEINGLILDIHLRIPNFPSSDTPIGESEDQNVVLREWGIKRDFGKEGFNPLEHWQIGENLGIIDTDTAAKVSGSRFAYLFGDLVKLQFALIQLGLEKLTSEDFVDEIVKEYDLPIQSKPFLPVIPPVLINPEPFGRMARIEPREERYHIQIDDQYLIGSAEHTLGPIYMDQLLEEKELPIRLLGYSTSFRREAGSYGKTQREFCVFISLIN